MAGSLGEGLRSLPMVGSVICCRGDVEAAQECLRVITLPGQLLMQQLRKTAQKSPPSLMRYFHRLFVHTEGSERWKGSSGGRRPHQTASSSSVHDRRLYVRPVFLHGRAVVLGAVVLCFHVGDTSVV